MVGMGSMLNTPGGGVRELTEAAKTLFHPNPNDVTRSGKSTELS